MSHHDADPEVVNAGNKPEIGYEYRDVENHFGLILKITFWFFVFTAISALFTIPVLNMAANVHREEDKGLFDLQGPIRGGYRPRTPANAPLVQSDTLVAKDIHELRHEQERAKNSYGWVDEGKGIVRIPIEDAIQKAARSGIEPSKPAGGSGQ